MSRRLPLTADPITARIESLSHDGRGVAHIGGKTVFVDNALPGEEVHLRYARRRGRYDEAVATEILESSSQRVTPQCPHFGICGGCSLQHLAPAAQLAHKQQVLLEQLAHIGRVEPEKILPPISGPRWGYRRRARLGVRWVAKKERIVIGFREKNSRHVADLATCPVLHPTVGDKIVELRELIGALDCSQQIPQIEVSVDDHGAALTVRHLRALTERDQERLQQAAEQNHWLVYSQAGGVDSVIPIAPPPTRVLSFQIPRHGVTLHFAPLDFIQVNADVNLAVIDRVIELLEPHATDSVLDLYCGLGNFTLPLARYVGKIVGVEGETGLITRTRENARLNGLANADFVQADLTNAEPPTGPFNKVLLDPPRTGALEILGRLNLSDVQRLVYVSCNPATLARDAGALVHERGLSLVSAGVMDMFPYTSHVESIALFQS